MSPRASTSPKEKADCVSILCFSWLLRLLKLGYKRDLKEDDVFPVLHSDHSSALGTKLENNWYMHLDSCAKNKKKPSFRWVVFKTFGKKYIFYGIFGLLEECVFRMIQVVSVGVFIQMFTAVDSKRSPKALGALACAGIILASVMFLLSFHWSAFSTHHLCTHMRLSISSLIYRKTMRLSQATMRSFSIGQLITLLSSDVYRFDLQDMHLNYLWIAPIQLAVVIYMLYFHYDFGIGSLGGLILLVIFVICQMCIAKYVSKMRMKKILATNKRLRIVTEIMNAFYTIKLYAWETLFRTRAMDSRLEELIFIKHTLLLRIINTSLSLILTKMTVFLTLIFIIYFEKETLTAEKVFISLLLYEHVRFNLAHLFTFAATDLAEINVTFRRMDDFLLLEERFPDPNRYIIETCSSDITPNGISSARVLLDNITCKWHPRQDHPTLRNINLDLTAGTLTVLVGSIGCGKSSLLSAILGELPSLEGKIRVRGSVGYVPQTPWIFPGNIRQNITFGKKYDQQWFQEVIEMTGLQSDLEHMAKGDLTKADGVGLSVGQKARIGLARAIYSNSDIYLLDDPLNCIDVRLQRHILEKSIRGALQNKVVLLVTHQFSSLVAADEIILMSEGEITGHGSYNELLKSGYNFAKEVEDRGELLEDPTDPKRQAPMVMNSSKTIGGIVGKAEDKSSSSQSTIATLATLATVRETSSIIRDLESAQTDKIMEAHKIGLGLFWSYIKSSSSWFLISMLIILCVLVQSVHSASEYWLEHWTHKEEETGYHTNTNTDDNISRALEIVVYCVLIAALVLLAILRGIVMFKICINASLTLFSQLINSLLHAKTRCLEESGNGRGINCFSKDMIIVDELLPNTLHEFIGVMFEIAGCAVILTFTNYWFLLPSIFYVVVIVLLYRIYHRSASNLKRIEGNTKSPIYAHTIKSLEGVVTIRAFQQEKIFLKIYDDLQDKHTAAWYLYVAIPAWIGVAVDWISICLIAFVAICFLSGDTESSAAKVGLAMAKVIELSILAQFAVSSLTDSETEMISVERILEYTLQESEGEWEIPSTHPPKYWPHRGEIMYDNICVQGYNQSMPLSNIDITIKAGEKLGVVGRSGSGKTTFLNALFRISEAKQGRLLIDGYNIVELGLHDLRKKLSIIPQVPYILSGTLRMNIDPFQEYQEREVWSVLDDVGLFEIVKSMEAGLNTMIHDSGWTFSPGQLQLLCLARAMLQNNNILCCDEATANLDPQTQSLMLKKIRERFSKSTIITVAHRLHAITDCDKIVMLENGKIVEYGEPCRLIDAQGAFYDLVLHMGRTNAGEIFRLFKEREERIEVLVQKASSAFIRTLTQRKTDKNK